jgi:hypothetical protein
LGAIFLGAPLIAQETGPLPGAAPQHDGPAGLPQAAQPAPSRQPGMPMQPPPASAASKAPTSAISKDPPSMPVDQIIKTFAEKEAEFKTERDNFTYTQDFDVQTIDDDGRPDGEYRMTSDITYSSAGQRQEYVTYAPAPTLERVMLSENDFNDLRNITPFVLTTDDLPQYNITYVGHQKVDQIGTYVFDVAPKVIEKKHRYFQGRIWVDDRDFEIVRTSGKAVPDIRSHGNEDLSPSFVMYRDNIEGHYWFPVYAHADDFLNFTGQPSVHIRMTVRYTDYKRFRVTSRLVPGTTTPTNKP